MAIDFIKVTPANTTPHASLLLQYVSTLRSAYELGVRVKAIMGHMNDGSNFTQIVTEFGLPNGQGQTIFDLINGSVGSMEGAFQTADAKNLTERVG